MMYLILNMASFALRLISWLILNLQIKSEWKENISVIIKLSDILILMITSL